MSSGCSVLPHLRASSCSFCVYACVYIYIYIWSIVIDCCSYITYSNSSPKKASAFVDTGQAPMTLRSGWIPRGGKDRVYLWCIYYIFVGEPCWISLLSLLRKHSTAYHSAVNPHNQRSKYAPIKAQRNVSTQTELARACMSSSIYTAPCVLRTIEENEICPA